MKNKILQFIYEHPKKVLVFFSLFFLMLLPGLSLLKNNFTYKVWYNADDPMLLLYEKFEKKFGNDANLIVGIQNDKGIVTHESLGLINKLTDEMGLIKDIIRVDSLSNHDFISIDGDNIDVDNLAMIEEGDEISEKELQLLRSRISKDKLLKNYIVDADLKLTLLIAQLRPEFNKVPEYENLTKDLHQLIDKYEAAYPDYRFIVSGDVIITDEFRSSSFNDLSTLLPLLYLLFTLILIYIYRKISGVILPYLVISVSILMMMGAGGFLGIQLNVMTIVAPTILMTVTIADAIHILTVYFLCLKNGFSKLDAGKYSLNKNFYPTLLTTVSTSLGFLSFATAKVVPVSELGILVGIGVLFAWIVTYGILGPILLIGHKESITLENKLDKKMVEVTSTSLRNTDRVFKYRYEILILTVISVILGFYYSSQLEVNLDPIAQFKSGNKVVEDYYFLEEKLKGATSIELMIDSGQAEQVKSPEFLKNVEKLEKWLKSSPRVSKTLSVNDYLKKTHQALNGGEDKEFRIADDRETIGQEIFFYTLNLPEGRDLNNRVSLDYRFLRLTFWWNIKDSQNALKFFKSIKNKAKSLGLNLEISGKTPLFHEITPYLVPTFFKSIVFAIISITILLMIILKSFSLGLLTLIPNVLPLVLGGGVYYLLGYNVDTVTIIIASVCLGIAVDDSIHFLFEFKRYTHNGRGYREAISKIMTTTYPSLFFTTLIVALGFAVFVFGSYVPNIKFGLMVAFILSMALVADFIVLPACLFIMEEKRND